MLLVSVTVEEIQPIKLFSLNMISVGAQVLRSPLDTENNVIILRAALGYHGNKLTYVVQD